MSQEKVTVAIPTYNRADLLKRCMESVLAQDYPDLRLLVLDNASDDDTDMVVRSLAKEDQRITYIRHEKNIGFARNWQRIIEVNQSPYLTIVPDDDLILPSFIRESVQALDEHPSAGFSLALPKFIDENGTILPQKQDTGDMPDGLIKGLEYIDLCIAWRGCSIYTATTMMRAAAIAEVGSFDSPHSWTTIDSNLSFRLAARFDIVFLKKELALIRAHPGQISEHPWQKFSVLAESIDAIAYLLQSDRAADPTYRQQLGERLLALNARKSESIHHLVPHLYWSWTERLELAAQDVAALIPPGESFILVDQNQWGGEFVGDRHAIPFIERDGQYWGPPTDDETAISEIERSLSRGASFIVFGWPAFWWLYHYDRLHRYLRDNFRCVLKNSRLVAFDLREC
ncbi:glycosyl transferase family protein [Calothrix sp. NIES-2100]|uniref:glycosyltransferase family 2 protein n=1 Tax=Calothrix sp. NIES-2100 TaxID=1954172 RepID=UPI000B60EDF4|nr:glycosyl transferase family protein [Calothrix sp. NIES-2100]